MYVWGLLWRKFGPFCWPMLAAGTAVFGTSHRFTEHASQMYWFHWDSASCSGSDQQQTTKQWLWLFLGGCKFDFGKCFGAFSGRHQLSYKIHFSSIITIQSRNDSLWLRRVKEDNTSKQRFFLFSVSSWSTLLLRVLFHLFNLLQMLNNELRMADIEFFVSFSCSYERISFNDALSWLLSTSDDWPLHSSSSSLSSPLQNFLKHHCTVSSLAVPGPMCYWCWKLCLLLYDRFWTQIRKSQCRGPRFNPWSGNLIPHATTKDLLCHNEDPRQPNK